MKTQRMTTISSEQVHAPGIAIIGMAGRFPGARDVAAFWQSLVTGNSAIRSFSRAELMAAGIRLPTPALLDELFAGAPLDDVESFDAEFFGFTPEEATQTDPQQRLFLECAWEALELAAYNPLAYPGTIGVFAGMGAPLYSYYNQPPESLANVLSTEVDVLAAMVAFRLNLHGPSVAVQTFCSTSLVAVHLACRTLAAYDCDIALAGGVQLSVPHLVGTETWDHVTGNGVGVVVLKRLDEAVADGDTIYAVVRGSAINNDGSGAHRIEQTGTSLYGRVAAVINAQTSANISPESLGLIELHGTLQSASDAGELMALVQAFQRGTQRKQCCALGTITPNIGYLGRASGVVSLIKATLALVYRQLPPTLDAETPLDIDLANSPFYINTQPLPWLASETPRRAGVCSFGQGGTNVHLILEEPPTPARIEDARSFQLLLLSARTPGALAQMTANLAAYCRDQPELNLADVAYTLHVGRRAFSHQHALVCRDRLGAIGALEKLSSAGVSQHEIGRRVFWHFPLAAQASLALAHELYLAEPVFRSAADRCYNMLAPQLAKPAWQEAIRGQSTAEAAPFSTFNLLDLLNTTQPATMRLRNWLLRPLLFLTQYALAQVLLQWGIRPQAMSGWGVGEYVAACLAKVMSLDDALSLLIAQSEDLRLMPEEAALLVPLSETDVRPHLSRMMRLTFAAESYGIVVGRPARVRALERAFAKQGVTCLALGAPIAALLGLPVAAAQRFRQRLAQVRLAAPATPFFSSITGVAITPEQATDAAYWFNQAHSTARPALAHQIPPEIVLLEVGVREKFSQAFGSTGGANANMTLTIETVTHIHGSYQAALLEMLGRLCLLGVSIDWEGFYEGQQRRRVPLPTYPFERQPYWFG